MAEEILEIERYMANVSFRYKFENVSKIFDRSPTFFARNIPFFLELCRGKEALAFVLIGIRNEEVLSVNGECQLSLISPSGIAVRSARFSVTFKRGMSFHKKVLSELFPPEEIAMIKDDAVTIKVSLWLEEPEGIEFRSPKERLRQDLQNAGNQELSNAFASFLDSGEFSDVTIITSADSSKVKAHKTILAARSLVFARMLTTDMKEAKDNEIVIDDMGAPALQIMLRYIYTGQLGFPKGLKIDLEICQELANAGEKYDLQNLKKYGAMAMTEFVSLENGRELLLFAKRLKALAAIKALASYCKKYSL